MAVTISGTTGVSLTDTNSVPAAAIQADAVTSTAIQSSAVTPAKLSQPLTRGAGVTATGTTSIDFTSIPSWVSRITVMFSALGTNGSSNLQIQLGTSSGFTTSGYKSAATSGGGSGTFVTTGLVATWAMASTNSCYGALIISKVGNNDWVYTGSVRTNTSNGLNTVGGGGTIAGTVTQLRVTSINGTDLIDSGFANIIWE